MFLPVCETDLLFNIKEDKEAIFKTSRRICRAGLVKGQASRPGRAIDEDAFFILREGCLLLDYSSLARLFLSILTVPTLRE